jgi:hypothetical protein
VTKEESADICYVALQRHIEDALKQEGLPPLRVAEFQENLERIKAARRQLADHALEPTTIGK